MTEVIIHGEMGRIFGKNHKFKVCKLLEIISALNTNRKGFRNYVIDRSNDGIHYAMINPKNPEKEYKSVQELQEADVPETVHIVPAISGAFLFTAAAVIGGLLMTGVGAVATFLGSGSFLANLAIGLLIQGVMSLLFPVELPKQNVQTAESKIDTSSYIFSNLDNNLLQGFPIPLLYGELRVGSNIIGTNVISEDLGNAPESTSTNYSAGIYGPDQIAALEEHDAGGAGGHNCSDIRLKRNIEFIGLSKSGLKIYEFNYIFKDGRYQGVMAQDLLKLDKNHPAVIYKLFNSNSSEGYYMVDHNQIDVEFKKVS